MAPQGPGRGDGLTGGTGYGPRGMGPGRRPEPPPSEERTNVVIGALWMVIISLALFFVPLVNGLIGGLVGGYKVGGVGRALFAALLPALLVALGLWGLLALFELPVVGLVAAGALGLIIILADVGLFLGAAIGGALKASRLRSERQLHA